MTFVKIREMKIAIRGSNAVPNLVSLGSYMDDAEGEIFVDEGFRPFRPTKR